MKTIISANLGPVLFLSIYQTILVVVLPFYLYFEPPSLAMIFISVVLLFATGISITGGYHRYYAHRTYRTNRFVEAVILFFSTMSAQGSALRWAFDHRIHHAFVDTDKDPYSIKKGFLYAHCLWLLEAPKAIDPKVVPDLISNPLVMFQHKYYPYLMVLTNAIAFFAVGFLLNDYLGAFILAVWTRMFVLHHFTWFINSLAHTWGEKPFSQEQTAVDNYLLCLLTFGEGYHNYHHTFANDYRNGIRWYHFDPTKWTIWTLEKLGLAYGLKRMDSIAIKKRMVLESKSVIQEKIKDIFFVKRDELEQILDEFSDRLFREWQEFSQLTTRYYECKKLKEKDRLQEIRQELKLLKRQLKSDWKRWKKLTRQIMSLESLQLPSSA
jgi:stearoyl-CoA desaturase (delta-9 desaturase)